METFRPRQHNIGEQPQKFVPLASSWTFWPKFRISHSAFRIYAEPMQSPDILSLVRQIHASGRQLVLAATGGGSGAVSALCGVPGASRSVLEAVVPYSAAALIAWLQAQPEQSCSDRTGRTMAMAAYMRARRLTGDAACIVGVGCTASLASDRPKRGEHRIHVAWQSEASTHTAGIVLAKDRRSRAEEEDLATTLILNAVAQACSLADELPLQLLDGEQVHYDWCHAPPAWQDLWAGRTRALAVGGPPSAAPPRAIFSGAFNPRHSGHEQIAVVAAELLGVPVEWELPVFNADKPPLDYLEVRNRLAQHPVEQPIWLTRAPTFAEKAVLFPGATFIVGADTIVRIAEPRFYGGDERARDAAIEQLARQGCHFLVFGRIVSNAGGEATKSGREFLTLSQLALPPALRALCREVPAEQFRADISSTQLRAAGPEA